MAEMSKEELNIEEFEIKEEIVSFKEEILPSSTVEDTCTVNIKEEDVKNEFLGKFSFNTNLLNSQLYLYFLFSIYNGSFSDL